MPKRKRKIKTVAVSTAPVPEDNFFFITTTLFINNIHFGNKK